MTLPAFSQAGTGSTGNPSWPTHASGDFGLLFIEWDGTNNPSTPSGWTIIPGFPVTQPTTKLAGYYRFATSNAESAPTISITAEDHHWAVILTYTGVNTLNPFHLVATTSSGSITQKTFPGFTTFLNDCMIVNVLAWGLDNAGPLFSGEVNPDLGSLTERYDAGTISASGGGLYVVDGTKAAKGAFGYTQSTASVANVSNGAVLALQAADQSFGTKSQIVNNKRRTMLTKQSTAQDFRVAMFDSADGVTGKTGLTLAVTLQKQGDTSFASISPTVTEIGTGHYNIALTTTHMNTVGCTSLRATATGAIPADCPNCIDVIAFDKTSATSLGLSNLDAAITSRLAPTTAGRTLDVSAGGEAGLDWANIGSPTTVVGLSGTTIKNTTDVAAQITTLSSDAASGLASLQADTDDIQTRLPAALGANGNIKADLRDVLGTAAPAPTVAGIPKVEDATLQGRLTSTRAGYLDNLSAGAVATASALATLATAVAALPTATAVRDAILAYAYRSGRTVKGLFRRLGAALETADGLKGTTVNYYQPDGTTVEFSVSQNTTSGTRSSPVVTNSEA